MLKNLLALIICSSATQLLSLYFLVIDWEFVFLLISIKYVTCCWVRLLLNLTASLLIRIPFIVDSAQGVVYFFLCPICIFMLVVSVGVSLKFIYSRFSYNGWVWRFFLSLLLVVLGLAKVLIVSVAYCMDEKDSYPDFDDIDGWSGFFDSFKMPSNISSRCASPLNVLPTPEEQPQPQQDSVVRLPPSNITVFPIGQAPDLPFDAPNPDRLTLDQFRERQTKKICELMQQQAFFSVNSTKNGFIRDRAQEICLQADNASWADAVVVSIMEEQIKTLMLDLQNKETCHTPGQTYEPIAFIPTQILAGEHVVTTCSAGSKSTIVENIKNLYSNVIVGTIQPSTPSVALNGSPAVHYDIPIGPRSAFYVRPSSSGSSYPVGSNTAPSNSLCTTSQYTGNSVYWNVVSGNSFPKDFSSEEKSPEFSALEKSSKKRRHN